MATADYIIPRASIVLATMAAAVIVLSGAHAVRDILGPVLLALVVAITAQPLRQWLNSYLPSALAATACIVAIVLVLGGLALSILLAIARFGSLLGDYQEQFQTLILGTVERLKDLGVSEEAIAQVASSLDFGKLAAFFLDVLGGLAGTMSSFAFVLALCLFMTIDASGFGKHLERLRDERGPLVTALMEFGQGTRRYLWVSTVFGLIVAVLDAIALQLLGVPAPWLWGLLAFLTNYIPNVGFIIGLIPPAILGLLEDGPGMMIAVIAIYSVLNIVIQSGIQNKVVGDSVGLSVTITFVSLVFWSWILGPIGAILAVPLSLLVKALFVDADPGNRWLSPVIANSDPGTASGAETAPRPA